MQQDPTLDELLDEPIVRLLMESHGVTAAEIRQLMEEARRRTRSDGFVGPVPATPARRLALAG